MGEAVSTEIPSLQDPIIQFSPYTTVAMINNRVRINPNFIIEPQWNSQHTGLERCKGTRLPASEFTKKVQDAIATDPEKKGGIYHLLFQELDSPKNPLTPTEALRAGFKLYYQYVHALHEHQPVDQQNIKIIREAVGNRLSVLQGLYYFQEHTRSLPSEIASCIPDAMQLQEYADSLANLDAGNSYLEIPIENQETTRLIVPQLPQGKMTQRPKTLEEILNEQGAGYFKE